MKGVVKKLLCLATAVVLGISAAACGSGATMNKIEKSGKLVIGTSAEYAPYEYHTRLDGRDTIVGIDISIAQEISKDLGVQPEIVDMGFERLIDALNTGKVDIVIAGMIPDEDREKAVDFSKVYYEARQGVLVRSEDKERIKSVADLSGKKIGAQSGTVQEKIAKEQFKNSDLTAAGKISDLVLELKDRKIDALVVELPVADGYVKNNDDLIISDIKVKEEIGGSAIAVKKGNSELVRLVDKSLDRLRAEGSIDEFVREANEKNMTAEK